MAARNLCEPATLDRGVVLVFGGGTGAGNADLTAIKGAGITSIVDGGTGEYDILLADKWNSLLFFSATVISTDTADDWEVLVRAETVSTTKLISITVFKGGTAADLTTTEKLKFMIALSNTSQPPTAR
jgi:hypothetical protein